MMDLRLFSGMKLRTKFDTISYSIILFQIYLKRQKKTFSLISQTYLIMINIEMLLQNIFIHALQKLKYVHVSLVIYILLANMN